MKAREEKLNEIIRWAETNPDIRAVLLTSSLVNPYAPVDDLSDLDIELVLLDRNRYETNNDWINIFGDPVCIIEEKDDVFDSVHAMKMVLYSDHVKIDFKLYGIQEFNKEVQSEALPDDWDVGYKVLIDKDGMTGSMKAPAYQSVMITKPDMQEFHRLITDFWWDTSYVAKCLKRGDIFYAKYMSENIIRTEYLVPLIEWYIASEHHWENITTNKHGRLFRKYLSNDLWQKVESTFSGHDTEENWKALWAMIDLVHILGTRLSECLGYTYPSDVEKGMMKHLIYVQNLKNNF
ncbi:MULTISPECIES: AadS family aminoglycoside 6-adenylyltransferase [Chryseobacterium]|uniref:Aminoglycoside 6-adenylyltransferase n=1 Tax=Chryseobacterium camelliae TaxID=1265445 RepID=A0ABU0TD95_9FLAO|nr:MULTISPECIES: AadS family aminoglycoside 6-adenylyltransferase [Chryseobacterium]MDT3407190.1 aminoglycoside 6-adenylyltransferase [Pseudacidovorax intermedius]MDQ1095019.1 aminoglycoside 6-adenylyltransferase [Chryseobacterium camelliae]MDQ1098959.1 aminoglycoside 6-adenylyltransferase [Chryseobacterium sp. SORGH_AS_1048]MDR6086307.1 aminoglycoside 6-adenylyltransferase [Chryseobacterium sp. SORGH_AS_0909]MDR6130679.1 aminoglycoside 6-adenylyltransferase [Chryseobacterium sp. SORGH_AS_1175